MNRSWSFFRGAPPWTRAVSRARNADKACSATSSPDGTLTGMLMFDRLTESPIDATSTGTDVSGLPLPVRTVTFTPRAAYPYGQQCGRFISAGLILDAARPPAGGLAASRKVHSDELAEHQPLDPRGLVGPARLRAGHRLGHA